ncbi:MAG: pyridoxamine 5'-phosphate oxidase family protein [Pseudomonadota bacterium]|jgi:uncharacterized protein YhbP (UPF0306 family)
MKSNNEKARAIIRANRYMSLATSAGGEPWVAPVAYAYDEHFNLFWYSEKTAQHSRHIEINDSVVVAIFNSQASSDEVDGLQISGKAAEVAPSQLPTIVELYFRQSFTDEAVRDRWSKPAECFMGDAPQRFYRFKPFSVFKCDTECTSVDRRMLVDLTAD